MAPPIKDTLNKGHDGNNIKFQCTKWRLSCSSYTLLTSDKGQPLNKGQNGQKTMGPKRVRYSEVPLYMGERAPVMHVCHVANVVIF